MQPDTLSPGMAGTKPNNNTDTRKKYNHVISHCDIHLAALLCHQRQVGRMPSEFPLLWNGGTAPRHVYRRISRADSLVRRRCPCDMGSPQTAYGGASDDHGGQDGCCHAAISPAASCGLILTHDSPYGQRRQGQFCVRFHSRMEKNLVIVRPVAWRVSASLHNRRVPPFSARIHCHSQLAPVVKSSLQRTYRGCHKPSSPSRAAGAYARLAVRAQTKQPEAQASG